MGSVNKDIVNNLSSIYKNIMQLEANNVPPAIIQEAAGYSHKFIDYIKKVENPGKRGFQLGRWYPIRISSTEIDIGYGHKITVGENFSKGLTNDEVEQLLLADLQEAERKVKHYLSERYNRNTFTNLDKDRQEMLIDFAFNLGSLKAFPKFVQAVVFNDVAGMRNEYERSAFIDGKRKLLQRNVIFFDTFLKNYNGGYFIASM